MLSRQSHCRFQFAFALHHKGQITANIPPCSSSKRDSS
jgi:hypothetical protein